MRTFLGFAVLLCMPAAPPLAEAAASEVKVLFDFEERSDVAAWSNLDAGDSGSKEPPAKWELSPQHAAAGRQSLKISFAGGLWPTLTTTQIPPDWTPYETFLADVTVDRPCLVGFTVLQEGSQRGSGYAPAMSRWTKTEFLKTGKNSITATLHPSKFGAILPKHGRVVRLEIFMYAPHEGESIYVDNIRLSTQKEPPPEKPKTAFKVLGTDLVVGDVRELGTKLAKKWIVPQPQTVAQAEAAFKATYESLKVKHPRAALAIFRDGEKGGDPLRPDEEYRGWEDAYWTSHGPDGNNAQRAVNDGDQAKHEVFMRHRSPLMRVDCSSIPQGSNILAAKLLIVRAEAPAGADQKQGPHHANMWAAEACNRRWKEKEVNAFQFAKDKFWRAIGGQHYGEDPDFLPVYLAHGPAQPGCSTWDFAHAVRFWTDGQHENCGFMLHGDAADKMSGWTREAEQCENRPALLVIYEHLPPAKAANSESLGGAEIAWRAGGAGGTPSFTRHVVPLLSKAGCNNRNCHGSFQGQNGFRLSLFGHDAKLDHDELTLNEGKGARVNPSAPDDSPALRKPLGELDHGGGKVLDRGSWQYNLLRSWIAAGAPYDPQRVPRLTNLEISPREASLALADKSRVRLRLAATFDDGSREDVTPLTLFSSNDDAVARVDEAGEVSVAGRGDTSIVAAYAGVLLTAQVFVPVEAAGSFPEYPAKNPIDDLVAAKLKKLGIRPSVLSSDEEFLRRIYLDLIGTLPTSEEARRFLADRDDGKRDRLIDELLERPEYAMYWATKFSDWTGNYNDRSTSAKVAWKWQEWLRDKLARNVPYDELVGGFLTATSREGRTGAELIEEHDKLAEQLAGGFDVSTYAARKTNDLYWLKLDATPETLAQQSAYAFLGIRLECAECHRHPFDRWTQEDYRGFAAFFDAVGQGVQSDIKDVLVKRGTKLGRFGFKEAYLADKHKTKVQPKLLGGAEIPFEPGKDPRSGLMAWLRSPENPLLAQAIANRLWGHYFGVGIISPVDDINAANPPSNPQLLEWLARDFVEHGFDLKRLHRRILGSRTYQLTWIPNDSNRLDERNFSHALLRRLPAEVLLDAVNQATGTANQYAPSDAPPGTRAIGLAPTLLAGGSPAYVLGVFGRPQRTQNCDCQRRSDASVGQALYLINDKEVQDKIADEQGRVARLVTECSDDAALIEELYLSTLSRYPTADEAKTAREFVAVAADRQAAMRDVLWSLLNVREFVFIR